MKEYVLSVNNFLDPVTFDGNNALLVLIYRLLVLEPGTNPLHPSMGVGIGSIYKYITEEDVANLQTIVEYQLKTFLPSINTNIQAELEFNEDNELVITVLIDGTSFVIDTGDIEDNTVYLSELTTN